MKKLLLLICLLPLFASAQIVLPDSVFQVGTNFTPQFNFIGNYSATMKIQVRNPLAAGGGKYFGLYTAYQTSQIFAPKLNPIFSGTITGGLIRVTQGGVLSDALGLINVTSPLDGNNYAYFGMTRRTGVAWGLGIGTTNDWLLGSGSTRDIGSTIPNDSVRVRVTTYGDATFRGVVRSQHIEDLTPDSIATINNDGSIGRIAASAFASTSGSTVTVATIYDMINYAGTATAITVKDKYRGGVFIKKTGFTVDSGIVFPNNWVRTGYNGIADASWYGMHPDSTMNGLRGMHWAESPYAAELNINLPGSYNMERPLYINGKTGLKITMSGGAILKHPNEVPYTLLATIAPGANSFSITDASKYFAVGMVVGLYSTAAPIVDTATGANQPGMSVGTITGIVGNVITTDSAYRYGYNTDSAAVVRNVSSPIVLRNSTDITFNNIILDGNKANAFVGYPQTIQTEADNANTGLAIIGSSGIQINNPTIYNFHINNTKWTRNNYRIWMNGGYLYGADGKNHVANYGGSNFWIDGLIVDRAEYGDNINFNSDSGPTITNIWINNVKSSNAGRYGLRTRGATTNAIVSNFKSVNDGGAIETEGVDNKFSDIQIKSVRDSRYNPGTIPAAILIAGAATKFNMLTIDSVGAVPSMIKYEAANIQVANGTYKNMPTSVSSGKAVHGGISGATNVVITNSMYLNVDSSKILKNTTSGTVFAPITTSGSTIVAADRPNFGGLANNRNRFFNYTEGNGIDIVDNTGVVSIDGTASVIWDGGTQKFANTTFPLYMERAAGSAVGLSWSRPTTSRRWDMLMTSTSESGSNAGSNFQFRANTDAGAALGDVFTVVRSTQVMTFTKNPANTNTATGTGGTDSVLVKNDTDNTFRRISPTYYATNPLTTNGDIIYGVGTTPTRLAIGGANTLLHGGASAPSWSAIVNADITNGTITPGKADTTSSGASGFATKAYVGKYALNNSPALTGVPTAPTASPGTPTTQIATTQFVINTSGRQFQYQASGDGVSTTLSIAHGLGSITASSSVIVQANNAATAGVQYATVDATNIYLTYLVAPALGTNNLLFTASIAP